MNNNARISMKCQFGEEAKTNQGDCKNVNLKIIELNVRFA